MQVASGPIGRETIHFEAPKAATLNAKLTKCSPDTALRDMRELVTRHIFIQNSGGGRSTNYRLISYEELEKHDASEGI